MIKHLFSFTVIIEIFFISQYPNIFLIYHNYLSHKVCFVLFVLAESGKVHIQHFTLIKMSNSLINSCNFNSTTFRLSRRGFCLSPGVRTLKLLWNKTFYSNLKLKHLWNANGKLSSIFNSIKLGTKTYLLNLNWNSSKHFETN